MRIFLTVLAILFFIPTLFFSYHAVTIYLEARKLTTPDNLGLVFAFAALIFAVCFFVLSVFTCLGARDRAREK